MTEKRYPSSDTQPIDRQRLDELLAESTERDTARECPACGFIPRDPPCTVCGGAGMVSHEAWTAWSRKHDRAMVTCPRCCGEGDELIVQGRGRWHKERCSICQGNGRISAKECADYERKADQAAK